MWRSLQSPALTSKHNLDYTAVKFLVLIDRMTCVKQEFTPNLFYNEISIICLKKTTLLQMNLSLTPNIPFHQ